MHNDPKWSKMVQKGSKWSNMVKYYLVWSNMVQMLSLRSSKWVRYYQVSWSSFMVYITSSIQKWVPSPLCIFSAEFLALLVLSYGLFNTFSICFFFKCPHNTRNKTLILQLHISVYFIFTKWNYLSLSPLFEEAFEEENNMLCCYVHYARSNWRINFSQFLFSQYRGIIFCYNRIIYANTGDLFFIFFALNIIYNWRALNVMHVLAARFRVTHCHSSDMIIIFT